MRSAQPRRAQSSRLRVATNCFVTKARSTADGSQRPAPQVDAFAVPDHILRAPIGLGGAGAGPPPDVYREYLLAAGFDV
jgi:hypothetical protein